MREIKKIALIAVGSEGWTGGIHYNMNILNALNIIHAKVEVHIYKFETQNLPSVENFKNISIQIHRYDELFEPKTLYNRTKGFIKRKFFKYRNPRVEEYFLRNNFDYIFPEHLSDYEGKLNTGSWIADFQYHNYPEGASVNVIDYASRTIKDIALNAPKIILSSYVCEKECHELFPSSFGRTFVMPFAVYINTSLITDNLDAIRDKYQLPSKYIVVSNLFAPTKDHKTLFEALGILKSRGVHVPLYCTGNFVDSRNLRFPNEILSLLTQFKIHDLVNILGMIPREDQIAIYRMSTFLVQPSLHEGWNTTVEEAKLLGKTIIVSDIDVHKEQIPDELYHFNKSDANNLANKIFDFWDNPSDEKFPNIEQEQIALEAYNNEVIKFGLNFMNIAKAKN